MSFLRVAALGSVALTLLACGLDAGGLAAGDGGAATVEEAGAPSLDGTVGGNGDEAAAPPSSESGSGEDAEATAPDAEGGPFDLDSGEDTGAPDAGQDAADSACPGTCTVAAVPPDWTVVELEEGAASAPACSPGYGSPDDVVENPGGGPATCACTCPVTAGGTCENGTVQLSVDQGTGTACGLGPYPVPVDGGCEVSSVAFKASNLKVDPAPYSPGSCTPHATSTIPPATETGARVCASTGAPAGTCPGGGACAATPPPGFSLCIAHNGTPPCPAGFTKPAHAVGTLSDTRGCTTCGCGPATATCGGAQLTVYTDNACKDGAENVSANDTCNSAGGNTYDSYEYSAQVQSEGCAASGGAPTGSVTLGNEQTICCQ